MLFLRRHHFVEMLLRQYHISADHFGWSYVLSRIQDKYWIVRGQSTVRHYIKPCIFCQFKRAKSSKQLMAPLPKERTFTGQRVFLISGWDIFGRILLGREEGKEI